MKKRILFLFTCCFLAVMLFSGAKAMPDLSCRAACVVEMETGRVLFSQQDDEKLPMASTTKIMTALLVIEGGDLDRVVTIPQQAVGVEGSSVYLKQGEQFTRKSLLYALMLASGNDVAVALAIDQAGSVDAFITMMNDRAKEIGVTDTHFVNPHGLPADGHYTTAHDLACITAVAMNNPTFCEIVGTKSIVIEPQGEGVRRTLQNKNKLLWQFDGALGVKTGYTKAAGRCLVGAASRDGKQVVAVVLNAPDMWDDISILMEDTLQSLSHVTLRQKGEQMGTVIVEGGVCADVETVLGSDMVVCVTNEEMQRIQYEISLPERIGAPVENGECIGSVDVYLDGICLQHADILAAQSVKKATYSYFLSRLVRMWIGATP